MLYILCVKRNSIARNRQFYNLVKREGVYNVAIETKLFRLVFQLIQFLPRVSWNWDEELANFFCIMFLVVSSTSEN